MKFIFSDICIDTMIYFLEVGMEELERKKLKSDLNKIDMELYMSGKQCRKVLLDIEKRRNKLKGVGDEKENKKENKKKPRKDNTKKIR